MRSPAATLSAVRCQNVIAVCGAKGSIKLTEAPPLTQLAGSRLMPGGDGEYRHASVRSERMWS